MAAELLLLLMRGVLWAEGESLEDCDHASAQCAAVILSFYLSFCRTCTQPRTRQCRPAKLAGHIAAPPTTQSPQLICIALCTAPICSGLSRCAVTHGLSRVVAIARRRYSQLQSSRLVLVAGLLRELPPAGQAQAFQDDSSCNYSITDRFATI